MIHPGRSQTSVSGTTLLRRNTVRHDSEEVDTDVFVADWK
jgi:hypothetical protein